MVANRSKFRLLVFLTKYKNLEESMTFVGKTIKSSDTVELLGNTFDRNINFKRHIENVCSKGNLFRRLRKLFRIRKFLNLEQAQILAEGNILSYFKYYH